MIEDAADTFRAHNTPSKRRRRWDEDDRLPQQDGSVSGDESDGENTSGDSSGDEAEPNAVYGAFQALFGGRGSDGPNGTASPSSYATAAAAEAENAASGTGLSPSESESESESDMGPGPGSGAGNLDTADSSSSSSSSSSESPLSSESEEAEGEERTTPVMSSVSGGGGAATATGGREMEDKSESAAAAFSCSAAFRALYHPELQRHASAAAVARLDEQASTFSSSASFSPVEEHKTDNLGVAHIQDGPRASLAGELCLDRARGSVRGSVVRSFGTFEGGKAAAATAAAAPERYITSRLKQRLCWQSLPEALGGDRLPSLTESLFNVFDGYRDVLLSGRRMQQARDYRIAYCLHALNHVLKDQEVVRNNSVRVGEAATKESKARAVLKEARIKVREARAEERKATATTTTAARGAAAAGAAAAAMSDEKAKAKIAARVTAAREEVSRASAAVTQATAAMPEFRDQGFTHAKVLLVVPYRSGAWEIVRLLQTLILRPGTSDSTKHIKKFRREFGPPEEDNGGQEEEEAEEEVESGGLAAAAGKKNSNKRKKKQNHHPNAEYRAIFKGNVDDNFCIGVGVRRTYLHLYADLHDKADIIVASPLGLRVLVGAEGDSVRDWDFLSAIEVAVFDQAEAYHMQNIEHLRTVLDVINRVPASPRAATDITRIRQWALDGHAACLRQTLLLTQVESPEFRAAFFRGKNLVGRVQLRPAKIPGHARSVVAPVRQGFYRVHADTFAEAAAARRRYFLDEVLPQITRAKRTHVLVFIPSYFDFVALRNEARSRRVSLAQLCEYTEPANVTRARSQFFHGERAVLLYTERFHYHVRPRIRRLRHVVFLAPPLFPQYYPELLNSTSGADASCTMIFTRYDALQLRGILGIQRTQRLLESERNVHLFV